MYITSCSLADEFVNPLDKTLKDVAFDKRFEKSLFMAFPVQLITLPACLLLLYALLTLAV